MSLDSVIMDFAVLIIHIFSTRKLYLTIYSSKMKGKILHTPSLIVTLNKHQAVKSRDLGCRPGFATGLLHALREVT